MFITVKCLYLVHCDARMSETASGTVLSHLPLPRTTQEDRKLVGIRLLYFPMPSDEGFQLGKELFDLGLIWRVER